MLFHLVHSPCARARVLPRFRPLSYGVVFLFHPFGVTLALTSSLASSGDCYLLLVPCCFDNEVLLFGDEPMPEGDFLHREICPSQVAIGQIAQVKIQFRLLKQDSGSFTFRELLKAVYVLDNGLREEIMCHRAMGALGVSRDVKRDIKAYRMSRNRAGPSSAASGSA